jgi:threonine dehydrogenase-like Zn-dependent dehydrogenase
MAAEFCDIKGGETIAVFGCGPAAQFYTATLKQGPEMYMKFHDKEEGCIKVMIKP